MLYQLRYASPDSLILLFSKTPRRQPKEGYRLKGYHTLERSATRRRKGIKQDCKGLIPYGIARQKNALIFRFHGQIRLHWTSISLTAKVG